MFPDYIIVENPRNKAEGKIRWMDIITMGVARGPFMPWSTKYSLSFP